MYKIEFTLKQHTPIIHFQHDQEGATLRATEVKPKLDRFIIERLTNQTGDAAFTAFKANPEWKKWLVGNGVHPALDYKVRIEQPKNVKFYLPLALKLNSNNENTLINYIHEKLNIDVILIAPSPYFANSDKFKLYNKQIDINSIKLEELRFAVKTIDNFKIFITCREKMLLDEITRNISLFFMLNNFGTRQSKGFGSFMPIDTIKLDEELLKQIEAPSELEAIYFKDFNHLDEHKLYDEINNIWKILKAGNSYKKYEKSDLFNYFYHLTPPVRWEKRAIKKNLKAHYLTVFNKLKYNDITSKSNRILAESDIQDNHFFVRALLGLAENNEFGAFGNGNKIKIQITDSLANNERTKDKVIGRFKSPITFKIVENRIYMFVYKVNPLLQTDVDGKDREFNFELNAYIDGNNKSGLLTKLKIPKNFSVAGFLDSDKFDTSTGKKTGTTIAKSIGFKKL